MFRHASAGNQSHDLALGLYDAGLHNRSRNRARNWVHSRIWRSRDYFLSTPPTRKTAIVPFLRPKFVGRHVLGMTKMTWKWPVGWPPRVNIRAVEWKFRAFGYPQSQNRNCLRSCGRYFTSCGAVQNPTNPYCAIAVQHARRGAAALGLSLDVAEVSTVSELDASFRAIGQKSPDAALMIADPFLAHERALLAKLLVEDHA